MEGEIWVESELGRGSNFYFSAVFGIPQTENKADLPAAVPNRDSVTRALRILLAEDNPVNQRLAKRILEKSGHSVTVANNGREAVAALQASDWNFDGVLMDIQMPEMDGLEATQAIRKLESSVGRHLPIIALTAHAMERDRNSCLNAGMDRHLTKPIQAPLLLATLQEIADGTFHSSSLPNPGLS
jgi:CheY-like chemotaxis protein